MVMDKQEYLNQISATVTPVKQPSKFTSSPFFKIIIIGLSALVLVILFGVILSSIQGREKSRSISLKLHLDNLSATISEYQPSVKSSALRSHSASLSSILSNTNRDLTDFLTTKYDFKPKSVDQNLLTTETALSDSLNTELFEAKINGLLDRVYARKMAYEISYLATHESELIKSTKSSALKDLLTTSYNSLSNLYDKFNDFSETK